MALSWWWHLFKNGAEIEANRIRDCERFLHKKNKNYTIIDPDKNHQHVLWKESSRWAKLKYWDEVMTLQEKKEMQNKRKREVIRHTEVIDI